MHTESRTKNETSSQKPATSVWLLYRIPEGRLFGPVPYLHHLMHEPSNGVMKSMVKMFDDNLDANAHTSYWWETNPFWL